MTTITSHPSLRGRAPDAASSEIRVGRRFAIVGESTTTFWILAILVGVLNLFGLVMVMSAGSVDSVRNSDAPWSYFQKQLMWTALGVVALLGALSVSVHFWRRFAKIAMLGSIGLLILVKVPGVGITRNGATRWLGAGPLQFQPSELVKLALLLFVADLMDRRSEHIDNWRLVLAPVTGYLVVVAGLIMLQPNLGTTIIIASIVLMMLFIGGARLMPLAAIAAIGTAIAASFIAFADFRRNRFLSFLNPWADPFKNGLQNVQSLVGMANGGILGKGLGRSTAKWGFLPFAHTDFIFAVIAEEFGLLGAMTIVALFVSLGVTGWIVALRAADRFSMLVATGITTWLLVQALMNIGAATGAMPITGVPLPFISFGGSSQLISLAATGILLNVARHPSPDPLRVRLTRTKKP
ncbi:MAG: putative lipid II flippase FtsW [Acidimicrobiales bacterium]|nr:putative lipid II flippase FtsW [Acidimicrobiales bacterium]